MAENLGEGGASLHQKLEKEVPSRPSLKTPSAGFSGFVCQNVDAYWFSGRVAMLRLLGGGQALARLQAVGRGPSAHGAEHQVQGEIRNGLRFGLAGAVSGKAYKGL